MSANLETQYRGELSQLEHRVPIREKLTPEYFEQLEFLSVSARAPWDEAR
jgi:hypothetical protein